MSECGAGALRVRTRGCDLGVGAMKSSGWGHKIIEKRLNLRKFGKLFRKCSTRHRRVGLMPFIEVTMIQPPKIPTSPYVACRSSIADVEVNMRLDNLYRTGSTQVNKILFLIPPGSLIFNLLPNSNLRFLKRYHMFLLTL